MRTTFSILGLQKPQIRIPLISNHFAAGKTANGDNHAENCRRQSTWNRFKKQPSSCTRMHAKAANAEWNKCNPSSIRLDVTDQRSFEWRSWWIPNASSSEGSILLREKTVLIKIMSLQTQCRKRSGRKVKKEKASYPSHPVMGLAKPKPKNYMEELQTDWMNHLVQCYIFSYRRRVEKTPQS